jgi:hypothetical protein
MIIELGIKCYRNFPADPSWFEFGQLPVHNFSPGSLQTLYPADIAYEEGSVDGQTWTPWFYVDIEPSINNQIRVSYGEIRALWYPASYFPGSTEKRPELYIKNAGEAVKIADFSVTYIPDWGDGGWVSLGPVTINLAPPITPEFWTGFANTYEIP